MRRDHNELMGAAVSARYEPGLAEETERKQEVGNCCFAAAFMKCGRDLEMTVSPALMLLSRVVFAIATIRAEQMAMWVSLTQNLSQGQPEEFVTIGHRGGDR